MESERKICKLTVWNMCCLTNLGRQVNQQASQSTIYEKYPSDEIIQFHGIFHWSF